MHASVSVTLYISYLMLKERTTHVFIVKVSHHGGLLSLNAWKVGPPPRKIEMVYMPHSNEHDNRCPLEPAMLLSS